MFKLRIAARGMCYSFAQKNSVEELPAGLAKHSPLPILAWLQHETPSFKQNTYS